MKAEQNIQDTSRPHLTVVKGPLTLPDGKPEGKPQRNEVKATTPKMLMPEQPTGYIRCKKHDCL
ncbi:hypothetical protein JMG10_09470 [Nostoc ellipsosporum NOK]|jgi:SHS2 domain-containing protein|nr:hypothetical protein [Nostoc ellipsosporum NOK]